MKRNFLQILILALVALSYGCTSQTDEKNVSHSPELVSIHSPSTPLSSSEKGLIESINEFKPDKSIPYREYLKVNTKSPLNPCHVLIKEVIELNTTDTIVHLIDTCSRKVIGVLAAKYQYPDATTITKSVISNDTITKTTIDEYLGTYEEDYYELLIDSITSKLLLHNNSLVEIYKDSTRTIKKEALRK